MANITGTVACGIATARSVQQQLQGLQRQLLIAREECMQLPEDLAAAETLADIINHAQNAIAEIGRIDMMLHCV